ncbi:MAG: hypothetical protein PHS93_08820 [Candidatus Omnitrophica bacterium]|nr:hypothetical protein [Candidatus Omnitrophota bacterium]
MKITINDSYGTSLVAVLKLDGSPAKEKRFFESYSKLSTDDEGNKLVRELIHTGVCQESETFTTQRTTLEGGEGFAICRKTPNNQNSSGIVLHKFESIQALTSNAKEFLRGYMPKHKYVFPVWVGGVKGNVIFRDRWWYEIQGVWIGEPDVLGCTGRFWFNSNHNNQASLAWVPEAAEEVEAI